MKPGAYRRLFFWQVLRDGKSLHAFIYKPEPFGAQHHLGGVLGVALVEPICEQPIDGGHSFVAELDAVCLRVIGGSRVACGEHALDMV